MRFLFGDSTPFPLGYNFLATLEAFMTAATRIVQLDSEAQTAQRQYEELAQNRLRGVEALEQFHNVVMRAVHDTAQKVHHAHALEYAQKLSEFAAQYLEEHKRTTLGSNDRESMQLRANGDRRLAEQRAQLETFLKVAPMPVLRSKLSLRLNEGRDQRYQATAVFDHPDAIQTAFNLGTAQLPSWGAPRRVGDFAQGMELMVGVEKSWLRGTVTPKQQSIDDWIVTQADMNDEDALELVLRRKLGERELLVFRLRRSEGIVSGTVEHPGAGGEGAHPQAVARPDIAHLDRFWHALAASTRELLEKKEQLLSVLLDASPVFENGLVAAFVVRLVTLFAPTVREIAKRSPNEFELSLKIEHDGGRREEVYLRRDQLIGTLQPLPAAGRQIFAPLGLDTWVPGTTTLPPPVVPVE